MRIQCFAVPSLFFFFFRFSSHVGCSNQDKYCCLLCYFSVCLKLFDLSSQTYWRLRSTQKKNNRRWFNIFISKTACNFHNFIERKEKNYLLNEIGSVQFDIQVMYDLFFVVSDSKHPELSLIFVLLHCHRPIHIGIYSLIATLSTCSVAACIFHPYYHTHRRTNAHSCQGILPIEWYWAMCIIKDIGICEKKNQPSVALCGVCARAHSEHCNASCASDVICNQQQ